MGEPPALGDAAFFECNAIVYRLQCQSGWSNSFGGRPVLLFPYDFTLSNGNITIDSFTDIENTVAQIPSSIGGYPVSAIGDSAFYGNTNLITLNIPSGVRSIGYAAFAGCTGLTTAVIGSDVAEVGNWAFYGCTSLSNVYARGNAPSAGASVFKDAPATVYYLPGTGGWCATFGGRPTVLLPYAYTILGGTVRIDAYLGEGGRVEIPQSIEGAPVTEIGESAFENCATLTHVSLPESVTRIGMAAFSNCPLLASVDLSGWSLRSIGDWAFAGCDSLTSLVLPGDVNHIGSYAFAFCSALSEVYLASYSSPTLGDNVFDWTAVIVYHSGYGDSWGETFGGRPSIPFPFLFSVEDGTVTIGRYTGPDTGDIEIPSVIAGNPVTSIYDYAFAQYAGLTSVTIPDSVTSIGNDAFYGCSGLTSVTIPGDVTAIGYHAFAWCSSLTDIVIPDSVADINDYAFAWCSGLTSVTIGAGVTNIGYGAFLACTGLTKISVDAGNPSYSSNDGVLFNTTQATLIGFPGGKTGDYAIPDSVTNIAENAFWSCTGVTSIVIGSGVTSIGNGAFGGCLALTAIDVDTGNPSYSSANGVLFNKVQTDLISFPGGRAGDYAIPDSVTNIGDMAFAGCTGLTSVTIPDSVTAIGNMAFVGCTGLDRVTIPSSVITIGDWAFERCDRLTSATIGAGVTNISFGAFYYCTNLTALLFEGAPPTFSDYAFDGVSATIYYRPAFTPNWPSTFAGFQTRCWNPTVQRDAAFGFKSGRFGFMIGGNADIPIGVEATTNLAAGIWAPVTNATLDAAGSLYINDPSSSNQPSRFYRIVWP